MADADVQGMLIRIEATTAQLRQEIARGEAAVAQSAGKMDTSLGRIDTAFDRAGSSAESAAGLIKNALAAAIGAASIGTIIKTADSYSQMSDRIGMATKSFGEYNTVQDRLLATANRTYRPLEEAQELYIRTSDSLRSMGLSANQSTDVMDSFSYLLVTNSASADKASSAIDAYSKSLQTGKIEADSWQAMLAAMPTIVDTLSKATGKSAEEIRNLGAQGKLSLDTLTEGLQKSADANGLLADSMGVAVHDAVVALNNAFTVYIGQLNETTDGTGILAAGISVLADNFGTIAEVAGVAAVGALAAYARGLAASAAGAVLATKAAIDDAMARRAQATAVLLAAQADQQKAQTAVFLAEKELASSKTRISGMAVEKQLSLQLAEARMLEARATTAVGAAQGAIVGTGRTLLGLLGGPAGIALLAIGAATAFLTLRDNTGALEKKLGDLADPIEKLIKRFNELDRAGQSVTLRGLQETIADTQGKVAQMSGAMADKFANDLRNMGAAGADGLMAGLVSLPADTQAALDLVRKASKDQASGIVVDWKAVADELRLVPGVTEAMAVALEESGTSSASAAAQLNKLKETVSQLTGETDELTRAERENAAAKAEAAGVGQKYLEQLQKQLGAAQDKTALAAANRFIAENTLLTEDMITAIRAAATAKDAQQAADDAATKATKSGTSAVKEAATEAKNQTKALADLKTQADIAIASATGLAAAYVAGTDKSREFSLQQKVEEALLKTGSAARAEVIAKLTAEKDAQDKLAVSKSAYDLGKETADLIAQAKATLMGTDALAAYNSEKALTIALAGKSIEIGSEEYKQMLAATEAQREALKLVQQAGNSSGIMDRLYPEAKLLKDYTEDQKALNAAMELYPQNAASYQDALAKLGQEYEVNRSKATLWGQMTEGAIDRIDEAFATAWGNIGSGAESLWDSLKKGFKQTLGEIAHMLTTKPLLASISNWLTGADNGQGLSSVWGKLLGSATGQQGGSGGMSGMGGNLVSMGKSIYQAYSAITGVGSSVASGYASGGISGALSGGASYYGNMLSSISSTLSNGFTSLASTITGTAAVQTAATIGAQGASSALLSGAVSQGATTIGAQFSTGVATTTAATYAAAEAGAAATAASLGGQISAAVSSMAAMWPLAVVMGMYQSGKLYDAGVRPDAGEIMDSGGKTALGKVAMAPGAAMSGFFEAQDKVLSKVVGGKWAAILSGSTLHQAVTKYVGEKLFGGAWQTKNSGISLGVENGQLDAEQFIDQKKKGGLFSSSKKRTRYSALDAQTAESMAAVYDATEQGVIALVSRIGISANEGAFDGLNIAKSKLSTKGKTGEGIQKLVSDWFSSASDQMVGFLDGGTGGFGYSFAELAQRIASFETFNGTLDTLNIAVLGLSPHSMELANSLIAAAGGMEAFQTATNTYYDNFFSESEKADDTLSAITKQFAALGVALPGTRDAYRGMVEALDMTTASGQSMFMTLTGLAGNAAQAYSILEQRADAAAAATAASAAAAAEAAAAATAAAKEFADALKEALMGSVSSAMSAVQRAVSAEKDAATKAYNARVTSLNDMVSTATENVSGLTAVGNDLSAALKALRGDSDDAVKMLRAQAQATLQSALATARSGGSLSGLTGLEDALDTVSTNTTDLYGSLEDFNRDQGRTANVVAELNGINGKQLTTAEKSLKGLETQIDLAKKAYDAQMAALDNQLAFAQSQLDALNGVDSSVISVSAAISAMNASVVAALSAISGAATGATSTNNETLVESLYNSVLGRKSEAEGKANWVARLQSGAVTYDQLFAGFTGSDEYKQKKAAGVPGFASGGSFGGGLRLVGENGPELEVTGPSRIYNANQTAAMLSGGNGQDAANEVRQLRAELKSALFAIAKNTLKSAKNTELLPQKLEQELFA